VILCTDNRCQNLDYYYAKWRTGPLRLVWRAVDRIFLHVVYAHGFAVLFALILLAGLATFAASRTEAPRLKAILVISLFAVGLAAAIFQGSAYIYNTGPITVNWAATQQTIDGFGAASGGNVPTLTAAQMDFFYTDAGIHLKFIRLDIYPDLADCNANEGSGHCVNVSSGATLAAADLANAQAAVVRGALVWASEWSPPGSMKSNRNFLTGGAMENGTGNANFTALAAIQVSFVNLMTGTYGIPIYAISVQNEPDLSTNYPSCTWTAQQIHDYVPYLAAGLASAGHSSTKIMVAEAGTWKNTYATTAMNDATVAADIDILAAHGYRSSAALLSYSNITKQHQWQTEVSDFNPYDGSIKSGLTYATMLHDWLTISRVSSWQYWLLSGQDEFTDNEGLAGPGGNLAKRAYTFGNFSRFVQPGWIVVGVTNKTRLLVSAYKSPTSGAAIVVVNNGWTARNQVFSVGTTMGASVIPWVTSSSANLAPQAAVAVLSGSFTYKIPALSVVTFSSTAQ
jgi:glucuronoarabinoxylan endo-1,4-beta-xylanase